MSDVRARIATLVTFVGAMWVIRIADTFRADGRSIAGDGIVPRTTSHLAGILTAPLIHANWSHLIANTVPLLILGALVLVSGVGEFIAVTITCALVGGLGTWLFGSTAHHIGASGLVFGYAGYLLVRPAFDRRIGLLIITLVVLALYGSAMLASLVPRAGISWSGHFFGFMGGVLAARLSKPERTPTFGA